MDGTSKIISITKKEPLDDQDPNEGVKFSVKTRAPGTDEPVEFEVELKDQKLIASGQLEDQTATVCMPNAIYYFHDIFCLSNLIEIIIYFFNFR